MKHPEVRAMLTQARTSLLLDHFFFGSLAMYLKLVEDESIQTLAVDGKHILYNPEFVRTLTPPLRKSAVAHEIMHCVLEHISRRGGRDPFYWNCAGDYVVNLMLDKAKLEIGKGWLLDRQYDGMSTNQVYEKIYQKGNGSNGGGGGQLQPLCDIRSSAANATEATQQQMEWKNAVSTAAAAAQKQGKLPAGMERFVENDLDPKVPWRQAVIEYFDEVCKDDYTWSRANRRFLHYGLYLPTMWSEGMGESVITIDTSGSINQQILDAFGTEIRSYHATVRPRRTLVIYCDAKVNRVDEFGPDDELEFHLVGGGGTSFVPPFKYLEEQGIAPNVFVYLTDLCGDFPEDPGFPVLWASTTDQVAPFGRTIGIEV